MTKTRSILFIQFQSAMYLTQPYENEINQEHSLYPKQQEREIMERLVLEKVKFLSSHLNYLSVHFWSVHEHKYYYQIYGAIPNKNCD